MKNYTLTETEHADLYSGDDRKVYDLRHDLQKRLTHNTEVYDRDGIMLDVIQNGATQDA